MYPLYSRPINEGWGMKEDRKEIKNKKKKHVIFYIHCY